MSSQKTVRYLFVLLAGFLVAQVGTVAAAETVAPSSRCITATTKASHTTAVATMEKDIAAYSAQPLAAAAVQAYKDGLDTAWAAMEEPYCGYGSYGAASAVKSYSKSVVRARSAFLEAVKNMAKAKTATAAIATNPVPVQPTPAPAPVPAPAAVAVAPTAIAAPAPTPPKPAAALKIVRGLSRGMRSSAVTDLQNFLVKHFALKDGALPVTGYFGPMTEQYVVKYQVEQKIIPAPGAPGSGLIGPKTVQQMNAE